MEWGTIVQLRNGLKLVEFPSSHGDLVMEIYEFTETIMSMNNCISVSEYM